MGLLGKYTTYVGGVATDAHKLLVRCFPGSPFATPLTSGDEKAAQKLVIDVARAKVVNGVGGIQPVDGIQAGDLGMFPVGVNLSFTESPDVSTVKWVNAGDPANPYFPDITSPGAGKTEGKDKTTDPTDTVPAIEAVSTTSDPARQNLRNPVDDGPAVYGNNALGSPQKLGDSGGNV
jgi:hypothetical protein